MRFLDYFPRLASRRVRYAIAVSAVILTALCFLYAKEVVHSRYVVVATGVVALMLGLIARELIRRSGRDQKLKLLLYDLTNSGHIKREADIEPDWIGKLDGIIEGEIYGWAFDRNRPSLPPSVSIYVESGLAGESLAIQYRSDVGQRAFYFDLAQCCEAKSGICVEARFADGTIVPNSPLKVNIPFRSTPEHKETILFMHIAKTAGTAFREAMVENYKQSEIAYFYPDPPGFRMGHFDLLSLEQRSRFRLVIGHFQYGIHERFPQNSTYVTIVRDPTERVISHYYYLLDTQPETTRDGNSVLSLEQMLERRSTTHLDNLMVRSFSGVDAKDLPPGSIDQNVFDLALHHLRTRFVYVGYQERANEAYAALQTKFHWKPRACLPVVNRGTRPERCDERTLQAVEHFNHWDRKLYTEIGDLFP